MSWLKRIAGGAAGGPALMLVKLRSARFGQVLAGYGRFIELISEISEIQSGGHDGDLARLHAITDTLFETADSLIFDLNVMSGQQHSDFFDPLDRMRGEVRASLSRSRERSDRDREGAVSTLRPLTDADLSQVLARAAVLYRGVGLAACLGVAAGPVHNLAAGSDPVDFPEGGVLVAADITPEAELIRALRKASAVLTDFGSPVGHMATMVRDFGLPYIVGLGDATRRLATGQTVTVDAGRNAVYAGRVPELIDFGRDQDGEDAPERVLAGELRRSLSPLTIGGPLPGSPSLGQCETLHDLVHLAHELAGDALALQLMSRPDLNRAGPMLELPVLGKARIVDLGDGLAPELNRARAYFNDVRSAPLAALIAGLDALPVEAGAAPATGFCLAAVTDTRLCLIVSRNRGFDLVDALMGEDKEQNRLYCRFAGRARADDAGPWRGAFAREVLRRLGFSAARTVRAAAGGLTGLSRLEMDERIKTAGRLLGRIAERDREGWDEASVEERVSAFLARFG